MFKNIFNYRLLFITIALVVIFIRIPALTSRIIHTDEGMGIRASEQILSGTYHYWPKNGHGPTLFYFGALIREFAGTNIIFFRVITVIFMLLSLLILWLIYHRELNKIGEIILIAGLGLSSGMLFFSAYFIHEALLILLTVIALTSIERWFKTKKGIWITFFIVAISLMYMTKETALFTYVAWIIAGLIILLLNKKNKYLAGLISLKNTIFLILGCFISIVLYLLFFGKSLDLIIAPFLWLTERGLTMHLRPWYYFIILLFLHESFLLISGLIFALFITIEKQWEPKKLFFFLWFLLILIAYSAVPYKTPWLIPNIILPLGLFTAFSISSIWQKINKVLLVSIIIVLLSISLICLWSDNFWHPNRAQTYDYAYLQGGIGFHEFSSILNGISSLDKNRPLSLQVIGNGDELLYVITEKYNRQYAPFVPGLPIYINFFHSAEEMKKILSKTGYNYVFLKFTYYVPGPDIDLFVREDIWNVYKSKPDFILPNVIWPDGTMRYD